MLFLPEPKNKKYYIAFYNPSEKTKTPVLSEKRNYKLIRSCKGAARIYVRKYLQSGTPLSYFEISDAETNVVVFKEEYGRNFFFYLRAILRFFLLPTRKIA